MDRVYKALIMDPLCKGMGMGKTYENGMGKMYEMCIYLLALMCKKYLYLIISLLFQQSLTEQ